VTAVHESQKLRVKPNAGLHEESLETPVTQKRVRRTPTTQRGGREREKRFESCCSEGVYIGAFCSV